MDYNLVPTFDITLPILRAQRWYTSQKRRTYIFVGEKKHIDVNILTHMASAEKDNTHWHDMLETRGYGKRPSYPVTFIYATIWPDDHVSYALTKLVRYIQTSDDNTQSKNEAYPFAWNKDGILRFYWPSLNIDSAIDPWKKPFPIIEKQPNYTPYQLIGSDDINVILYDDMRGLPEKQIHMYFPDVKETEQLQSIQFIKKTEEYITNIWTARVPKILKKSTKIRGVIYKASFQPDELKVSLSDVFEKLQTDSKTQLIQWIDDITRVMYKLYKKHTIRTNLLKKWIDRYNIPDMPSLVFYDLWNKSTTFSKIHIQETGIIELTYSIDAMDHTMDTIADVEKHAMETIQTLRELLEVQIVDTELVDISYDLSMSVSMIGIHAEKMMYHINTELGKAVPLFFSVFMGQEGRKKTFIFKRASNLQYEFSLPEVTQSLLDYGIDNRDIRELLSGLGYTKQQLDNTWEELRFAEPEGRFIRPAINIEKEGIPLINFIQQDGTFSISIKHAPSTQEARLTIKWFASIIFYTIQSLYKEAEKEQIIPLSSSISEKTEKTEKFERSERSRVTEKTPSESISESESTSEKSKKKKTQIRKPTRESSSSFEFDGGARGMKKSGDGFLLEKLQKADPSIFAVREPDLNYARGCQQPFQPLVMSKEEWDTSKTKVQNSILYRNNYYSCPSIWCKETGIAMTPEELTQNKGKCPTTGETPVILWDKPKHRFVGFNKNIIIENGKKIYSPCCFKTDQFQKAFKKGNMYDDLIVYKNSGEELPFETKTIKAKIVKKMKKSDEAEEQSISDEEMNEEEKAIILGKESYILKKEGPVPLRGRYGSVPTALYRIFYPQYAEQGNNITTQPTIVRHGIGSHEDSLMESIAYALDLKPEKKNKIGLIEKIIEVLDPLTFISLEGGAVLASFISDGSPTITYDAWKQWIDQYSEYKKYMGLDDPSLNANSKVIIREMKIYEAYLKFIHHLQSDDEKNTRILYHLLSLQGVLLLIWERGKTDDDIGLSCPYFMNYQSLQKLIPNFKEHSLMLLHDSHYKYSYYEPLEIRTLNDMPITNIPLEEFPTINDIKSKCPVMYTQNDFVVIEKIRGMIYWVSSIFEFNTRQFMPKYVIISSDLHIEGLITNNNLWIQLPRPSLDILPRCIEMLSSMKLKLWVRYHEDLDYNSFVAMVDKQQYDLFRQKCDTFGFKVSDKIPPPAPVVPIVSIVTNKYNDIFENMDNEFKELRNIQLKIARYMLYNYNEKVSPHIEKPRKEFIDSMLTIVLKDLLKQKETSESGSTAIVSSKLRSQVKTAIEEMPLIYGKEALQKWIHTITIEPYHFYDSNLYTEKKAWSFSQLAVEVGLPKDVLVPTAASTPKKDRIPDDDDLYPVELNQQIEPTILTENPLMAHEDKVIITKMPIKWDNINFQLMKLTNYEPEYIPNLCNWIANKIHSPLTWQDVMDIKYIQIANIFEKLSKQEFKKALDPLLQENTFKKIWINKLNENKLIKEDELLEVMWDKRLELSDILKEIADMDPSPLLPMNMDLQIMAQLFDIFIMVIFRKPYSSSTAEQNVAKIENLRLSSELYCNQYTTMERPLVILYREKMDDNIYKYNLTLSEKKESEKKEYYHTSASDASEIIQDIIKAHIKKRT